MKSSGLTPRSARYLRQQFSPAAPTATLCFFSVVDASLSKLCLTSAIYATTWCVRTTFAQNTILDSMCFSPGLTPVSAPECQGHWVPRRRAVLRDLPRRRDVVRRDRVPDLRRAARGLDSKVFDPKSLSTYREPVRFRSDIPLSGLLSALRSMCLSRKQRMPRSVSSGSPTSVNFHATQ